MELVQVNGLHHSLLETLNDIACDKWLWVTFFTDFRRLHH